MRVPRTEWTVPVCHPCDAQQTGHFVISVIFAGVLTNFFALAVKI